MVGRNSYTFICPVDPDTGEPYVLGTGVASSVTITGAALTAMQATATSTAAIDTDTTTIIARLDTLITAIGAAGDLADASTVIGQLKQIVINTA